MSRSDKLLAAALGIVVGSIFQQIISIIIELILAPMYGFKCDYIGIFGFRIMRSGQGWTTSFEKFGKCECGISVDRTKLNTGNVEANSMKILYIRDIVTLLLGCVVFVVFFEPFRVLVVNNNTDMQGLFMGLIAPSTLILCIVSLGATIMLHYRMKTSLAGYSEVYYNKLRAGVSFENLDMQPISQLGFKKVWDAEIMMYDMLYAIYLHEKNCMEELEQVCDEMYGIIKKTEHLEMTYVLGYYWLIYYYSGIKGNKERADFVFNIIESVITVDADSNAKRTMGYYCLLNRDFERAHTYAQEGLAGLSNMTSVPERELERKCLLELERRLQEIQVQNTQNSVLAESYS